jgi:hypothetical protein
MDWPLGEPEIKDHDEVDERHNHQQAHPLAKACLAEDVAECPDDCDAHHKADHDRNYTFHIYSLMLSVTDGVGEQGPGDRPL